MSGSYEEIRERYRKSALEWAAASDNPDLANRLFDRLYALYKVIRDLEDGKRALVSLMNDPEVPVRLMAATHSLPIAPEIAQQVLEDLERRADLYSVTAKYTLKGWRAGKLDLD